jgi:predicted ATPase
MTRVNHARRIGHPFDLGWVLATGTVIFDYLYEPDEVLKRAEEAERLGHEYGLRFLTSFSAPAAFGSAWIRKGREADGIPLIQAALTFWDASGGGIVIPYFKMILAEGRAQQGDVQGALALIDESIAQIERPGWEERYCYAEVLRIKGWLLSRQGDVAGAERYYGASIDQARRQHAKSWELRSASSYARLLREQGRVKDARDLLAPVYGWFTEGFETRDLREAKALLDLLGEAALS